MKPRSDGRDFRASTDELAAAYRHSPKGLRDTLISRTDRPTKAALLGLTMTLGLVGCGGALPAPASPQAWASGRPLYIDTRKTARSENVPEDIVQGVSKHLEEDVKALGFVSAEYPRPDIPMLKLEYVGRNEIKAGLWRAGVLVERYEIDMGDCTSAAWGVVADANEECLARGLSVRLAASAELKKTSTELSQKGPTAAGPAVSPPPQADPAPSNLNATRKVAVVFTAAFKETPARDSIKKLLESNNMVVLDSVQTQSAVAFVAGSGWSADTLEQLRSSLSVDSVFKFDEVVIDSGHNAIELDVRTNSGTKKYFGSPDQISVLTLQAIEESKARAAAPVPVSTTPPSPVATAAAEPTVSESNTPVVVAVAPEAGKKDSGTGGAEFTMAYSSALGLGGGGTFKLALDKHYDDGAFLLYFSTLFFIKPGSDGAGDRATAMFPLALGLRLGSPDFGLIFREGGAPYGTSPPGTNTFYYGIVNDAGMTVYFGRSVKFTISGDWYANAHSAYAISLGIGS